MKPFSRLSEGEGTDVERLLLGSAKDDAPSPNARLQTLGVLGLSAAAAATAAGTAHAASATAISGAGAKAFSSASGLALMKWVALGAVAGVVTTGSIAVVTTPTMFGSTEPSPTAVSAPARRVLPSHDEGLLAQGAPPAANEPGVSTVVPQQEPRGAVDWAAPHSRPAPADQPALDRAPAPQGTAFPIASADTVAEEVSALDRARSALATGNPAGALSGLDAYERRYPHGTLSPEATVLRVRALVQLGRRRDAQTVVDGFVRAHPGSAQAARLRALVGEVE